MVLQSKDTVRRPTTRGNPLIEILQFASVPTVVGIGVLFGALLPTTAAVAVGILLLSPLLLYLTGVRRDKMTERVIKGRKMAKIDGDFVVFHIGSRMNNIIDPFYTWMGDAMRGILEEQAVRSSAITICLDAHHLIVLSLACAAVDTSTAV